MKLNIEIQETRGGNIALRMRRQEGIATDLELAYADAITEHLKAEIPVIGKKLGGKGLIGGNAKGN